MTSRRSILAGLGAAAVGFSLTAGAQAAGKKLRFLNWDTYIGETTLKDFQRETGFGVDMHLFATNDELFDIVSTGRRGAYDVIVPSNDNLERMIATGLLQPLDHGKLPNLANIDPAFRNPPYDTGCRYAAPFTWLVLGVAYRKSMMRAGAKLDSWGWLFDKTVYDGNVALCADPVPLFQVAALYLGQNPDDMTPPVIAQIEDLLKQRRPAYHNDDGQDMLLGGEVELVMEYNGDIAQARTMADDDDLDFFVPSEGGLLMADSWAIPAKAPNPDAAHAFLNYMLSAEGGRHITETISYPTPNAAVKSAMPASYRDNPVMFPPWGKSTFVTQPGEEVRRQIEDAFARVQDEA